MTETEFENAMAVLFEGCRQRMTDAQMEVWFQCLGDLSIGSLQTAILRWLSEVDSGFPTIAAIRERAVEATHGRLMGADEAFTLVCETVGKISPHYETERFMANLPGAVAQAVRACGGPQWIGDMEADSRTTYAAQFRRAYESISGRESVNRRLPESLRPRTALPAPEVARLAERFTLPMPLTREGA